MAAKKPAEQTKAFVLDSFLNVNQRLGLGSGSQMDGSGYGLTMLTRNRLQLEAAYRTSWIVGNAVDAPADDMTRAGVQFESDLEPDEDARMHAAWRDLMIGQELANTERWARLYGGAIGVMMLEGQNVSTPLNLDSISLGQFKGLMVLDRWVAQADVTDIVTEMGPDFGLPKFYNVYGDYTQRTPLMRVHYSRVVRRIGTPLPYFQRATEMLWGASVLERVWDRLIAFDSASTGAAQLVFKAHLRTLSVEQYRDLVASGGKAFEGFAKQIENIRLFQNTEGLTVIDAKDTFETHSYSFAGLPDIIEKFAEQLSGALEIPIVRLFGQSPGGLNSTGESDLRTYYDQIKKKQEGLRRPIQIILDVLSRSVLGKPLPDGFSFGFTPLWQMSDKEKADTAKVVTDAVGAAYSGGMITGRVAAQELKASSRVTGVYSNISDQDIDAMEDEIPDPVETAAAMAEATTVPDPSEPGANADDAE